MKYDDDIPYLYTHLNDEELTEYIVSECTRQWFDLGYTQEELDKLLTRIRTDRMWRAVMLDVFRTGNAR